MPWMPIPWRASFTSSSLKGLITASIFRMPGPFWLPARRVEQASNGAPYHSSPGRGVKSRRSAVGEPEQLACQGARRWHAPPEPRRVPSPAQLRGSVAQRTGSCSTRRGCNSCTSAAPRRLPVPRPAEAPGSNPPVDLQIASPRLEDVALLAVLGDVEALALVFLVDAHADDRIHQPQ